MTGKKIFILHLSSLGDMLQSLPASKRLKDENPGSTVTFFGIEQFSAVLNDVPWIDRLVTVPWQDISDLFDESEKVDESIIDRLWTEIPELNQEYDLLVNFAHNRSSTFFSKRINARENKGRVFSAGNEIIVPGKWGKYLFAMVKNQKDNLLNLVDIYMGIAGVCSKPVEPFLPTDPVMDKQCFATLTDLGLETGRLSIGFQLGANLGNKIWGLGNFVRLGELLVNSLGAQIILFGSEREVDQGDQFRELAPFPFMSLIGKTGLSELGSFLRILDVLVSGDTGPAHIAAGVGTKVVGIFSGIGYFGFTGPYGSGHISVQSNYPCAPCLSSEACSEPLCSENIKPETVEQAVRLSLGMDTGPSDVDSGSSMYKSAFSSNGTLKYEVIEKDDDCFSTWLRSSPYLKAVISQILWNGWLGLDSDLSEFGLEKIDGHLKKLLQSFRESCLSYDALYAEGQRLCRKIIDQFEKEETNFQLIRIMMEALGVLEKRVKNMAGPLAILKEVHEYYMTETERCEFPRLAHQFLDKFSALRDITTGFETTLKRMEKVIDRLVPP